MVKAMQTCDRGDIIWLDFDPCAGHEQKGKRPALVVSPSAYFTKTGMALVCPISSSAKGYPFEVPINAKSISGVILVDHIKASDIIGRGFKKITTASPAVMTDVQRMLRKLVL